MARARGRGDDHAPRRDGPAGAGAAASLGARDPFDHARGQQSGSKRPAVKTGAAKKAPKKGEKG
jgi:hypothetical protein